MAIKKTKTFLKQPIEYFDEMGEASLADGQTKSDWLDYLQTFRDELSVQIDMVKREVDAEQRKKDESIGIK